LQLSVDTEHCIPIGKERAFDSHGSSKTVLKRAARNGRQVVVVDKYTPEGNVD
jgi:hypothetical protein